MESISYTDAMDYVANKGYEERKEMSDRDMEMEIASQYLDWHNNEHSSDEFEADIDWEDYWAAPENVQEFKDVLKHWEDEGLV